MAKRKIYLFYMVTVLFWFSTYIYVPMLPAYIKSRGASYLLIGLILGCYGVGQFLLRVPLGILSDRLNKRKIFVVMGMISLVISSLGLFLYDRPLLILVFRSFSGIASAFWVLFIVLYSGYFAESESTKAIGILNAFCNCGILAGLFLGGIVVRAFDMRTLFLISLVMAVIGLLLSLGVQEKTVERRPAKIRELLSVVRDKNFQTVSVIGVICQFVVFATIYGFTPVVARGLGASDFQISMLTALSAMPAVIGSALSGTFFAKKFGERRTMVYGLVIAATACCVIPFTPNLTILAVSQFIGGMGSGTVFPLLMGLSIKHVAGDKRATAMGIFQAVYGIGMFVGPTVVGALGDTIGIGWGFVTIGGVALVGALIALLYKEQMEKVTQ